MDSTTRPPRTPQLPDDWQPTCGCEPPCILQKIAAMSRGQLIDYAVNIAEELDMYRAEAAAPDAEAYKKGWMMGYRRCEEDAAAPDAGLQEALDDAWKRVYVRAGNLIWKRTQLTPADAQGIAEEIFNMIALAAHPAPAPDPEPSVIGLLESLQGGAAPAGPAVDVGRPPLSVDGTYNMTVLMHHQPTEFEKDHGRWMRDPEFRAAYLKFREELARLTSSDPTGEPDHE